MAQNPESSLPGVETMVDSDDIRVLTNGSSRRITLAKFKVLLTALTSTGIVRVSRAVALSTALDKDTDDVLLMDASGASLTVTLPDVTTVTLGKVYTIKKVDNSSTFTVTVATSLSQTIDGNDNFILAGPNQVFVNVLATATDWFVI